jgi:hypothetical protein
MTLLLAALLLVTGAAWWGVSWIDKPDSTCGGLHRPDLWLDGYPGCTTVMLTRLVVAVVLVGTAVLFTVAAARLPRWARTYGCRVAVGALVLLVALLVVNEAVRSDGSFTH